MDIIKKRGKTIKTGGKIAKKSGKTYKNGGNPKSAKIITRFFKDTELKRKSVFFNSVCSDSGVCVAFGKEKQKIIDFFDGFNDFRFLHSIVPIGKPSSNGFIRELQYVNSGYNAYAILKSSLSTKSDNLAYEFLVGRFLNKMSTIFPCFIETYGLFLYNNVEEQQKMKNTPEIIAEGVKEGNILSLQYTAIPDQLDNQNLDDNEYIIDACAKSDKLSILLQHINSVSTFSDHMKKIKKINQENMDFINLEIPAILYQIYFPLSMLFNRYTHHDLHGNNVFLYEPVKGKKIKYHFFTQDSPQKEIVFVSRFIVKIIDYGRNSYYSDSKNNTEKITKMVKKNCNKMGENEGFYFLQDYPKINESNDIRFLNLFNSIFDNISENIIKPEYNYKMKNIKHDFPFFSDFEEMGIKTLFGDSSENKYYVPENHTTGYPDSINNVRDAEKTIRNIIIKIPNFFTGEDEKNIIGDMYVNQSETGVLQSDFTQNKIKFILR
jgi:hypothetical protein